MCVCVCVCSFGGMSWVLESQEYDVCMFVSACPAVQLSSLRTATTWTSAHVCLGLRGVGVCVGVGV